MSDNDKKCFACRKPFRPGAAPRLADTRDDQRVYVGPECWSKIAAAGDSGYQPPTGGPRLYVGDVERAWCDLPPCVEVDPLARTTLTDLRYAARIQLDLIEEGQDGTEDDDPAAIRRWLRRYGSPAEIVR